MEAAILDVSGISKCYGAVQALSDVSFRVAPGEVHAILGENGAGKSTTLKIIKGELTPDAGQVSLRGKVVDAAERAIGDIEMVHQELTVFENMSVAENIFAGEMPRKNGRIDFKKMHARAAELLALFGLNVDTREIVSQLTPGQQQIVEILRAVEREPGVLILDEPTSGLNNLEAEVLLDLIKQLRATGQSILYVSHRLQEVLDIADHITVLRDGKFVETLVNRNLDEDALIARMVGRELGNERRGHGGTRGAVALELADLGREGAFDGVSMSLHEGEIVGVFGLEGSGAEELSEAMFGRGEMRLFGERVAHPTPTALMRGGMSYLPANRKEAGLYMERSIADNVSAPVLDRLSRRGMVHGRAVEELAHDSVRQFAIRVSGIGDTPQQLSGGNQQKVMVSACLANAPKVIVMNEPTRGVDVGAKAEVHEVVRAEAEAGHAVAIFSSDLPELLRLADRIVVMRSRRMVGEVGAKTMGEEAVMALAAGSA